MNYIDVYYSRINHLGETTGERIRNSSIRSFEKWLNDSPLTVRNLSVERGLYFDGIIHENKDKEHKKIMFLETANDIPLLVGDIVNWKLENDKIEKWIIFQEEKKTNPTYKTFLIIRCNYLLKWVDQKGHVKQSWAHCTSSMDAMVKENFRMWHELATAQPNKYMEVIMPRQKPEIYRTTNFLVEEEVWSIVDYDHTSVPGITYISLIETKINSLTDDKENNLADIDKIAQYKLSMPETEQIFALGAHIEPVFTLMKNGEPCDEEVNFFTTDKKIVRLIDNILIAVGRGTTTLIARLKNHPEVETSITITVGDSSEIKFSAYIDGSEKIKLNRANTYKLVGTSKIEGPVEYKIEETDLAEIISLDENECVIKANDKNKLGTIKLMATYLNVEYVKEIKVVPLW